MDVPKRIIEKYKGLTGDNRVFSVPSNSSCNEKLKKIGEQCGFKVRLTYHVSRQQPLRAVIIVNYQLKIYLYKWDLPYYIYKKQKAMMPEQHRILKEEKQEVYEKVRDMYDHKDEAREKFLNMHDYTQQKEQEISDLETRIEELKQEYEPYKTQDDLNLLLGVFPHLSERLRISQLCKGIGLTIDTIKQLFKGEPLSFTGKLYSLEHDQSFNVKDAKLQLFKESKDSDRLKLSINGQNIIDWFKQKLQELKQTTRPHMKPILSKQKRGQGV